MCPPCPRPRCSRMPLAVFLCMAAAVAGCGYGNPAAAVTRWVDVVTGRGAGEIVLRIATPWPRAEQARLEQAFLAEKRQTLPIRCVWITLSPGASMEGLASRIPPVDLYLGGPLTAYSRMARSASIVLSGGHGHGESPIRVVRRSVVEPGGLAAAPPGAIAFEDPRVDPVTLAWAAEQLRRGPWRERYAALVTLTGRSPHRAGWIPGSAATAGERWENGAAWVLSPGTGPPPASPGTASDSRPVVYEEGGAVAEGSSRAEAARLFLDFVAIRENSETGPSNSMPDPDWDELIADLLGAVLIDAKEELASAFEALDRLQPGIPTAAREWLVEPPPWPPASVEKLMRRGGDRGLTMVQDLTAQVAPDPECRFWLAQSWLRPARLVDDGLLSELAHAASGRLVREPSFRAWLRGEWTAWARQRYRRVARLAGS